MPPARLESLPEQRENKIATRYMAQIAAEAFGGGKQPFHRALAAVARCEKRTTLAQRS